MARLSEREFYALSLEDQFEWVFEHLDRENWINWPVMPLKQVHSDGGYDTGFLFVTDVMKGWIKVYYGNIFMLGNKVDLSKLSSNRYSSIREMVSDNWRVD
jgi:hypothetical protein